MKSNKMLYIILMILSLIMTAAVIIASFLDGSMQYDFFHSVWIVFLLGAFVLLQVICLIKTKPQFTLYKTGFYIFHIGIIVFLCGCFGFYISGDTVTVSVPIDPDAMYNTIKREEPDENGNTALELDFYMGVSDFYIEKYENADGSEGADKFYEATLKIMPPKSRDTEEVSLTVNHPHKVDGWKIYLMNYDKATVSTVQLTLKKDPGEMLTYAGIWSMIIGAFIMCLPKLRRAKP